MSKIRPFHIAITVSNLNSSRIFYNNILGCSLGRSSNSWIDFNFFGHQLVVHLGKNNNQKIDNHVDGHNIPVPHFGVVLEWNEWHLFSNKIKNKVQFKIEPHIRFKDKTGEQATMFFLDPDDNALEFKAFKNDNQIFEK